MCRVVWRNVFLNLLCMVDVAQGRWLEEKEKKEKKLQKMVLCERIKKKESFCLSLLIFTEKILYVDLERK